MSRFITLVRHGKVAGPSALYGHTDIAISEEGSKDLQRGIEWLHGMTPVTHVISSPLLRCINPAQEFSQRHKLPLRVLDNLKEMHFGCWDGIPFSAFTNEQFTELTNFWETPGDAHAPDGEALKDFAHRIISCWNDIEKNTGAQHQLVICHGGVIRIIIAQLLNLDWRNPSLFRQLTIDYASHTQIEIGMHDNALPMIKYIGATAYSNDVSET